MKLSEELSKDSQILKWFMEHIEDLDKKELIAFIVAFRIFIESIQPIYDHHALLLLKDYIANHAPDDNRENP